MIITCPSGLQFHARTWNLGDQGSLIEASIDDSQNVAIRMLELATIPNGVVDPGPYSFKEGGNVSWGDVTQVDITTANLEIRKASNPLVPFHQACTRCGKLPEDQVYIDLRDLEVYPASEEGLNHIRTNVPANMSLIDSQGRSVTVKVKLLFGRDMAFLSRFQEQEQSRMLEIQAVASIASIEVPGESSPLTTFQDIREYWRQQSWEFGEAVEEKVDGMGGSVDTTVVFRCDDLSCHREQEVPLPLDEKFYGLSGRHKRRRLRASSATPSASIEKTTPEVSLPSPPDTPKPPILTSEA